MKRISVKELATATATLLGESLLQECIPEESPFPDLEDQVRILSPELLSSLIMESPAELLTDAIRKMSAPAKVAADGSVTLEVPPDFLKLIYLKMSDWKRAVTIITPISSEAFKRQGTRWEGIKGNAERPLAFLLPGGLRLYSSHSNATLEEALYVQRPQIESDGTLAIPDNLYLPLLQRIAENIKGEA